MPLAFCFCPLSVNPASVLWREPSLVRKSSDWMIPSDTVASLAMMSFGVLRRGPDREARPNAACPGAAARRRPQRPTPRPPRRRLRLLTEQGRPSGGRLRLHPKFRRLDEQHPRAPTKVDGSHRQLRHRPERSRSSGVGRGTIVCLRPGFGGTRTSGWPFGQLSPNSSANERMVFREPSPNLSEKLNLGFRKLTRHSDHREPVKGGQTPHRVDPPPRLRPSRR